MFSLRKIYTFIFLVGVFFIPFNEFKGLSFLGEYSNEAAAYFFLVGSLLVFIEQLLIKKTIVPIRYSPIFLVAVFFVWAIASTALNFTEVSSSQFKGIGGINRFFRQLISLFFSAGLFLYFYINALRDYSIKKMFFTVRKVMLWSFTLVFVYGLFETAYMVFGVGAARPILKLFDLLPFFQGADYIDVRISSISYEPPFLAIFLITVAGFMFSYILTETKKVKYLPALGILFLTYFSGSRTALIIITFQVILFALVLLRQPKYRLYTAYLGAAFIIGLGTFLTTPSGQLVIKDAKEKIDTLNFEKNLLENVSNRSRFGMQYAQWQVFKEHPIIGVGLGQQAYYNKYYFPPWAVTNNYEFSLKYKNPQVSNYPPGFNLYLRILVEHGIIGLLIFLSIIFMCLKEAYAFFKVKDSIYSIFGASVFLSIIGLSINWLQADTYRFYGFWLCLAILYSINHQRKKEVQNTIKNNTEVKVV